MIKKEDGAVYLTAEEAKGLLPDCEEIHTFRNPAGMMLGADWSRDGIHAALVKHESTIQLTGKVASSMGHGIAINDGSTLFIETDKVKLAEFEKLVEAQ